MRHYARVGPGFWTGTTGREIRARGGRDGLHLAHYLITNPHATMLGLYYLSLPTLCHEAGFTEDEARHVLATLAAVGFAFYDPDAELVWVPTTARHQMGDALKEGDLRRRHVISGLQSLRKHPFARQFYRLYRTAYSLPAIKFQSEAPSKPLRSQEIEQEQEQEQEQELQEGRPANPLVNRNALVKEGHPLIREIATAEDLDPTEVLSKASEWRGRSYVRLDAMPEDRLAHTVNTLRSWARRLKGLKDPGPPAHAPPRNERAEGRLRGMNALIGGGLREGRAVDQGDERAGGELPGPGSAGAGPGGTRGRLPPGA